MGRLVRLVLGLWSKSPSGEWTFKETPNSTTEGIILHNTETVEGLVEMIRITLNLGILTPVALTYQLPDWFLNSDARTTPPCNLLTNKDVELLTSVLDYIPDPLLYVTSGPELVAKYQFFCRTPFSIDDKHYLQEGITEEQHRQAIIDLVGGHPIVCSKHMLEIMFNEPQLLLVFRVSLKIEKVYGLENDDDDIEDLGGNHLMNGDDVISLRETLPFSPDPLNTIAPTDQVLYGEPVNSEDVHNTMAYHEATAMVQDHSTLVVEPMNLWDEPSDEEAYWDAMAYELFVAPSQQAVDGSIGLPLTQNRRICAPQPPPIIVVDDDSEGSYTGSFNDLNNMENNSALPPPDDVVLISMGVENIGRQVSLIGESSAEMAIISNGNNGQNDNGFNPPFQAGETEPSLDLTLGLGMGNSCDEQTNDKKGEDSFDEAEDGSGGFGPLS